MARARTVALLGAGVLLLASSSSIATGEYGVTLRIQRARPDARRRDAPCRRLPAGRRRQLPVLLQRTPYNKDGDVGFALTRGTGAASWSIQDVRGRYASEGEWYPSSTSRTTG